MPVQKYTQVLETDPLRLWLYSEFERLFFPLGTADHLLHWPPRISTLETCFCPASKVFYWMKAHVIKASVEAQLAGQAPRDLELQWFWIFCTSSYKTFPRRYSYRAEILSLFSVLWDPAVRVVSGSACFNRSLYAVAQVTCVCSPKCSSVSLSQPYC